MSERGFICLGLEWPFERTGETWASFLAGHWRRFRLAASAELYQKKDKSITKDQSWHMKPLTSRMQPAIMVKHKRDRTVYIPAH